jgi:hypothetical protein
MVRLLVTLLLQGLPAPIHMWLLNILEDMCLLYFLEGQATRCRHLLHHQDHHQGMATQVQQMSPCWQAIQPRRFRPLLPKQFHMEQLQLRILHLLLVRMGPCSWFHSLGLSLLLLEILQALLHL